ncbi:MAG TPA: phosphomannomutase [Sedimenticola sp.]|nr:phosphomannomutase [Sedimenticola sp.]
MLIDDLMAESGVGFGTSGARGEVEAMTDRVCYAYVAGFLQQQREAGALEAGGRVAIAGDYRSSTPRIMAAAARAIADQGCEPVNCGFIPTPAVTLYGIEHAIPSLMVTGSHIPDDRNGIKFNKPGGEILKQDEEAIRRQRVTLPRDLFDREGALRERGALPPVEQGARGLYQRRYLDFFPAGTLKGRRIGLYEHSSVARGILGELLESLGAEVVRLGHSDRFVPVDTEAIRPEDVELARHWVVERGLDALVSTDGDGDRPLVSDERGEWLRGDVAGILCARFLEAGWVVTPVSSNTAVERCGWFQGVERTRIGSPYVIAAMETLQRQGRRRVIGYEANGGFLIGDPVERGGAALAPLPTRDAVIVVLSLLAWSRGEGVSISDLAGRLPARFTSSGRLKAFPTERARERLATFVTGDFTARKAALEAVFGTHFGPVAEVDTTDGVRVTFDSGEIVHLRPSGNAPELRCYNEAGSRERAREMNRICLEIMAAWRH